MKKILICMPLLIAFSVLAVFSQTTEFTYQGHLNTSGSPANGNYDFEFALYDSLLVGTQLGSTQTRNGVAVANGIFAVKLDFGNQFPGTNRFLEVRVRPSGQPGITVLAPRQSLDSHPYSVKSLSADNATTSNNALSLGGVVAGQYVLTADARLSDARNPLPGSTNYIQNQVVEAQPATNFNISGTGVANYFRANLAYFLNSDRILSAGGTANLFVGINAGFSNSSGESNSFVGNRSGYSNGIGGWNSFFGTDAGFSNTSGQLNSFFGKDAGELNTTATNNSFFGALAGSKTTVGCCNSFFGSGSGDHNTLGESNAFFGSSSGGQNTSGDQNSFFGNNAGYSNTVGANNSFVGFRAGWSNTTGVLNSFIGANAGDSNTTENGNTFIGAGSDAQAGVFQSTAVGSFSYVTRSNSLVLGGVQGVNGGGDTNVGIGTTAPGNRLQVVGALNGVATPTGHVALIENSSTGTSPDVLALKIGRATDPDSSNNFITFFRGDDTSVGSIQGNGSGGVVLGGPGSDYAEWLPRLDPNEKIEPGDIVGVFNGRVSRSTAGASQVMAVSTGAIVAGNDPGEKRRESHTLTAFIGQAMVNVIGAVRAGDLIIPSGLEDGSGIAVSSENISATQFGQAIGHAWESSDDTGFKKIRVAVGLVRNDPTMKRLFERTRSQEGEIRSLQRQVSELKKLICPANQLAEICKEDRK